MTTTITNVAGYQVTTSLNQSSYIDKLIAFEQGELDNDDTIILFQFLIDTGIAWQLQGFYGRTAHQLISIGHCYRADDLNRPDVVDALIEVPSLSSGE